MARKHLIRGYKQCPWWKRRCCPSGGKEKRADRNSVLCLSLWMQKPMTCKRKYKNTLYLNI